MVSMMVSSPLTPQEDDQVGHGVVELLEALGGAQSTGAILGIFGDFVGQHRGVEIQEAGVVVLLRTPMPRRRAVQSSAQRAVALVVGVARKSFHNSPVQKEPVQK